MAKTSWASVVNNTTDAGFRAWGSELASKLAAVGLVQTADTGQINWATVTRPATANTAAGSETWKLADSSLFVKIEYGTGAAVNTPNMWVTIGTGSNGAGTITGQTSTRRQIGHTASDAGGSSTTSRTSYLCATNDFFGLCWKAGGGASGTACAVLLLQKWCDAAGAPIADGFAAIYGSLSGNASQPNAIETVRTISPTKTWGVVSDFCLVPGGMTDSLMTDGDNQVFLHSVPTPRVIPLALSCSVFATEAAEGFTFSAKPVGATMRTFLSLGTQAGLAEKAGIGLAMLWE